MVSRFDRRQNAWVAAGLFTLMLFSRIPFRSQILYHWDSVNFAYALPEFSVAKEQPHPPGYILYVWPCRLVDLLFSDAQTTMVWISVVAMFLFNSSSIMWWGGFAVGPRYLLPMLPFMALPTLFVFRDWANRTWVKVLIVVLCAWSLIATWGLTLAEQAFPPDTMRNSLVEYAWPNWQAGNIARNLGMFLYLPGIASLLPLLVGVIALLVALWLLTRRDLASTGCIRGM